MRMDARHPNMLQASMFPQKGRWPVVSAEWMHLLGPRNSHLCGLRRRSVRCLLRCWCHPRKVQQRNRYWTPRMDHLTRNCMGYRMTVYHLILPIYKRIKMFTILTVNNSLGTSYINGVLCGVSKGEWRSINCIWCPIVHLLKLNTWNWAQASRTYQRQERVTRYINGE